MNVPSKKEKEKQYENRLATNHTYQLYPIYRMQPYSTQKNEKGVSKKTPDLCMYVYNT